MAEPSDKSITTPRAEAGEDTQKTPLNEAAPDKCVQMGNHLTDKEKQELFRSCTKTEMFSPGRQRTYKELAET